MAKCSSRYSPSGAAITRGTVNAAPYTIAWTPAAVGATTLTASATDSNGTTVTSTVLTVNVAAAAPTVALSAPLNGVVVTVGSNVTVSANATAGTGAAVSQVQFYAGSTLIGVDTTAPYSVTWVPASAGLQNITARVVDSTGATATSAVAAVTAVTARLTASTSQRVRRMDRARRDIVRQTPKHLDAPRGCFALRSPIRPNPVSLSVAELVRIDGNVLTMIG